MIPLTTDRTRTAGRWIALVVGLCGCQSPFYADKGAGVGALAGAGAGYLVGDAVGNEAAGTLVGAGLGALTGGLAGQAIDDVQAQNRAEIAAQLGRQVQAGAATIEEVVSLTRAGVDPTLIQNYVRTSGMTRPLSAQDVIYLHNNGVSTTVIQAMQTPAAPQMVAGAPVPAAGPVIVEEHYYPGYPPPPPFWGPGPGYHRHCRGGPQVSWGVSVVR